MKLNTLLAKTEHLGKLFHAMIQDYTHFFKDNRHFIGEKKTYVPNPDTADDPSQRSNRLIVTTVDEKLAWFEDNSTEYIDALFAQEATNAANIARADLVVEGVKWGNFSSLELLRLKSLIENGKLEQMYANIPVRSDAEEWKPCTQEMYIGRAYVFEGPFNEGEKKSIVKEQFILPDPNIERAKGNYTPVTGVRDSVLTLGKYTWQKFTGEWSSRDRAMLLRKRSLLLNAVVEALKVANDVEAVKSDLTADKIFSYLHGE